MPPRPDGNAPSREEKNKMLSPERRQELLERIAELDRDPRTREWLDLEIVMAVQRGEDALMSSDELLLRLVKKLDAITTTRH